MAPHAFRPPPHGIQVNGVDLMSASHQDVMKVLADRETKTFDFHVMRVNSRTELDA